MIQSMFEKLQCLPLLMGLSVAELMEIVEKVKFEFRKHQEGSQIVSQGEKCDKLIYVLSGTLCVSKHDVNHSFQIHEYFNKPLYVIEPQNMWGMSQKFDRTYTFTSEGSTCVVEKKQINYLMSHYDIIKTNFLNMICNMLQRATHLLSCKLPNNPEEKIKQFIKNNKIYFSGQTEIKINMKQLAQLVSDTRLNISKTLNLWQNKGLIQIHRGCIFILDDKKWI